MQTLLDAGYQAYLVGGCVRDGLLNLNPKDFDVATNAKPEEVKKLFRKCRLIGRRFRLAHVWQGRELIEVATFRSGDNAQTVQTAAGRILRDNVYGSLEDDARRRDMSINALYYDIASQQIIDHVGGLQDLIDKRIRLIGNPTTRYKEDPVRMLRTVRFSAKLGFEIDQQECDAVLKYGHLLEDVPAARLFDEVNKLFLSVYAWQGFQMLRDYNLLAHLLPMTYGALKSSRQQAWLKFIQIAMDNTKQRILEQKTLSPAFLYAVLLWPVVRELLIEKGELMPSEGTPHFLKMQQSAIQVLERQVYFTAIPKRFSQQIIDIWTLQPRLENYRGKRAMNLLNQPAFRAGFDFLLLREQAGEEINNRAAWWRDIQRDNPPYSAGARRNNRRQRRRSQRLKNAVVH